MGFTHEGDRSALAVLIEQTGLNEPAFDRIAEIVRSISGEELCSGSRGH